MTMIALWKELVRENSFLIYSLNKEGITGKLSLDRIARKMVPVKARVAKQKQKSPMFVSFRAQKRDV